ncbi:hypothetical protein HanRHA438_Chr16g0775401 [Helianthus annuus]|nr:hypothetical protein HanRHA438_Chr16g0775401 [Helianthus annuus]
MNFPPTGSNLHLCSGFTQKAKLCEFLCFFQNYLWCYKLIL